MKIFAVGMNYIQHNKELDGTLYKPESPVIFTKADSALLKDHKPFFIPDWSSQVDYETELVVRICRLGKSIPERLARRYYDAVTVGIDFTARDIQREARAKGLPWELCKGFDGSAVKTNAEMGAQELREYCALSPECEQVLKDAFETLRLSARARARILKVARTIADLEFSEEITAEHLYEAISYRTYGAGED